MEIVILIFKIIVSLLFLMLGLTKLTVTKSKLLDKGMKGLIHLSDTQIKLAGFLELLGAFGLILPHWLNFYPILTGLSAIGLSITMLVALKINYQLKLPILPNLLILCICLVIAFYELL